MAHLLEGSCGGCCGLLLEGSCLLAELVVSSRLGVELGGGGQSRLLLRVHVGGGAQ